MGWRISCDPGQPFCTLLLRLSFQLLHFSHRLCQHLRQQQHQHQPSPNLSISLSIFVIIASIISINLSSHCLLDLLSQLGHSLTIFSSPASSALSSAPSTASLQSSSSASSQSMSSLTESLLLLPHHNVQITNTLSIRENIITICKSYMYPSAVLVEQTVPRLFREKSGSASFPFALHQ